MCETFDKIRPIVGIFIAMTRMGLAITQFITVFMKGAIALTIPVLFTVQVVALVFIWFMNKEHEGNKRRVTRIYFFFVILLGSALWILNHYLVLESLEDEYNRKRNMSSEPRFVQMRKDIKEAEETFSTVFPPILIVCFVLDIFVTIKITEIFCFSKLSCCKDKVAVEEVLYEIAPVDQNTEEMRGVSRSHDMEAREIEIVRLAEVSQHVKAQKSQIEKL